MTRHAVCDAVCAVCLLFICVAPTRRAIAAMTPARRVHDVLVVGGGVLGAWTAAMAAKRGGVSVALADQFEPAHDRGSSHGDGRIFRLAYHQDHYVDMMLHALPLWKQLQEFAGEPLMATTGGLNIEPRSGASEVPRAGGLADLQQLYERRGFAHEMLSAAEVNERWPQFGLSDELQALYQPDFGVLFASRCVGAAWKFAASLGVEVHPAWRAASLAPDEEGGGGWCVTSEAGLTLRAKAVVFAPGAWLTPLARRLFGLEIPTTVTAETVSYFAPREASPVDHSQRSWWEGARRPCLRTPPRAPAWRLRALRTRLDMHPRAPPEQAGSRAVVSGPRLRLPTS